MDIRLKKHLRFHLKNLDYHRNTISKILKKNFNFKNKTILDLGCDDGFYEIKLKKLALKIIAIDINDVIIKIDRELIKNKKIQFKTDNIDKLKTSNYEKFDCILFMNMLFLVNFDQNFIKKLNSLLKKNGEVIMQIPNKESTPYRRFEDKNKKEKWVNIINEFSLEEVIKKMEKQGFKLTFKKGIFYSSAKRFRFYVSYFNKILDIFYKDKEPTHYILSFKKT